MGSIDRFLDDMKEKSKNYQRALRIDLEDAQAHFGNLATVTGPEMREYFRGLKEKYSAGTVNRKIASLRAFYRWLQAEGEIDQNPMVDVRMLPVPGRDEIKCLTPAQVEFLLAAAKGDVRDYALLRFMFDTATRAEEVTRVTVDDFKRARRSKKIKIHGKGGDEKYVAFGSPKTIAAVNAYLRERPDSEYQELFLSRLGKPLSTRAVYDIVRKYMLLANAKYNGKCNIPAELMHPHTLRHTAIKNYWNVTRDLKKTKDFARHGSISTTLRYTTGVDFEEQADDVKRLPWNEF